MGERMTIARTDVCRWMSASNRTLNMGSLSVAEEMFRYDDSSTTNGLFVEVLWEITRDKAERDRHGVEALHHEDVL